MYKKYLLIAISCLLGCHIALPARIKIGQKAPQFTLIADTGEKIDLNALAGKKVALCFYPELNDEGKQSSPFCKLQLKRLGDEAGFSRLKKENIVAFGINTDSIEQHLKFKKEYALPIPLLTCNKSILKAYDVKQWFGSAWMGRKTKRITVLIDEKGFVVDIIPEVALARHAQQILEGFVIV